MRTPRAQAAIPQVLTDRQLDRVTAGLRIGLDLVATASGRTAATSTAGAVQLGDADVLQATVDPNGAVRLVRDAPAQVAFGGGQSVAQGDDPSCAARITLVGDFAYVDQTPSMTVTPVSAICQCAAVAISFAPH